MAENEAQGDLLTSEASPGEAISWFSEENAEFVKRKGWEDGNSAIKSYRELEKMDSGKIKMPTPESSAEEIRSFYQKQGCPENPEGYELQIPEELLSLRDEGVENAMKEVAHAEGVSKQAFEAIVSKYYEKLNSDMAASRELGEQELKKEFGDKYDEVITTANRFFDSCSDEFCQLVKASGLANHPTFIKEFMNKGKQTMSDTLIEGEPDGDVEKGYTPQYPESPEMYKGGTSEDSLKAQAWFKAKGIKM